MNTPSTAETVIAAYESQADRVRTARPNTLNVKAVLAGIEKERARIERQADVLGTDGVAGVLEALDRFEDAVRANRTGS